MPYTESGKDLEIAWQAKKKAGEDLHIHHMLARAYGSIAGHGSQYDDLSPSDKKDIDYELKEYKKHFKVNKVDLPKMYEDYHSTAYEEFLKLDKRCSEAWERHNKERIEINKQIKEDMHQYVASLLWPYMNYLQATANSASETHEMAGAQNTPGRRPLGIFDSFEDMFNNNEHFMTIDNYIRTKGSLSSGEAKSIFTVINKPEYGILKARVSMGHFGTLIKKQYGLICTFASGKSVADGKIFKDVESAVKALLGITETTKTK